VASSIGKSLYIANIAPGASGGHFISGSNAGTTTFGALTVTGAFTAGTNALPWNASWDVEVQSECADALVAYDGLVPADLPSNFAALSINGSGHIILQDASLVTAKLGTFVLAKTTNITGFNDLSAAQVNTEADTALADYDGPTHAELTAELATADDATLAAIAALSIPTAIQNADALLIRNVSNVEASAPEHSLCTMILAGMEFSIVGTTLTIKRTDGTTTHFTKTLAKTPGDDPIRGAT
jgi:hypothetical protein